MSALWRGIVRDSPAVALAAFFPRAAYLQVKAIADPGADWHDRLLHDYALDIGAAHGLLGAHAAQARLLRVDMAAGYARWVAPGTCYNQVGYYEMPGARLVYSEEGQVRSFGIASMISWRGEWYVVHLGAVQRSGEGGVVAEPVSGPGTPAYSGAC
ncbi:MAG: hypothetical protein ACYDA6_11515 [Solirubrobacteraceae bacterium]